MLSVAFVSVFCIILSMAGRGLTFPTFVAPYFLREYNTIDVTTIDAATNV